MLSISRGGFMAVVVIDELRKALKEFENMPCDELCKRLAVEYVLNNVLSSTNEALREQVTALKLEIKQLRRNNNNEQ